MMGKRGTTVDEEALEATGDLLIALASLVRQVNLSGDADPKSKDAARKLLEKLSASRPPVTLNFVGAAILRGKAPVPLDLEVYRRSQQIVAALEKFGVQQLRFDASPDEDALIALAKAILDVTQGSGKARIPRLRGVDFLKLTVFGDADARDEATTDAFVAAQIHKSITETDRVITRGESRWPWRQARAPLLRLERCLSIGAASSVRAVDFVPGASTRGRRVLAAALTVGAVLQHVGAAESSRRPAMHAALALACHGLDERGGIPIEEAAHVTMGAFTKSRFEDCDPQALRACALVRAFERASKGMPHPSMLPLVRISYELERQRVPVGMPFELTRIDLWAWLADEMAQGRLHAGWGRAVIDAFGLVPAGGHVMADGRLSAVVGAARADAPLRPPVVVAGELTAPEGAVQPYSPLAMTPWAK